MSSLREIWRGKGRKALAVLTPFVLAFILYSHFAVWVETRPGVVLSDPLLSMFPPVDLTLPIFVALYSGLLVALFTLIRRPDAMLLTLTAYTLLLLVRIVVMYVVPFGSPEGMIVLVDPVAGIGPGSALENDLFFSGHTATMFLMFLTAASARLRRFFLGLTVALGLMLLLQHVHYTVDVLAAPFFAYGCYRGALVAGRRSPAYLAR